MTVLLYILVAALTFIFMEGVAWFTHKYIMHGALWVLHEDHHRPPPHFFEKNDLFFLIFAVPSFILILLGVRTPNYWLLSVGVGIMLYGAAYFLVHDIIIHQRFKLFTRSNNTYVKAVRWAHRMHHKHLDKHDGESFGMLIVGKRYWDRVREKEAERVRRASMSGTTHS